MTSGKLYWITGLAGAGKTTIGKELYNRLQPEHNNIIILDGDNLKHLFDDGELDYSRESRRGRATKYAKLCKLLVDQGMIVICCTISMFDSVREYNRTNIDNYCEVFVDVPVDVLVQRDQKGLYSGYLNNQVNQVVGMDVSEELPQNPSIRIVNDGKMTIKECVDKIMEL